MKTCTELAAELGVTHRLLRFYEDKGLLKPHREGRNRVRLYDDKQVQRAKDALRYARYGFSLREIKKGVTSDMLMKRFYEVPEEIEKLRMVRLGIAHELSLPEARNG